MSTAAENVTIQIDRQTAEGLRAQAQARGLSLDAFLRSVAGTPAGPAAPADLAEVDRWLDEVSRGLPAAPSHPPDFSREGTYGDHD